MTAIVLIGVMADRAALTLRTLAIAAIAVLLFAPQSVVHPSFQMSFAATLALIAAYERGLPWMARADTSMSARVALWGGREVAALVLASLVAGLATTPYAAYHFHRIAPYGVIANLFAMPIVSIWVMPSGLLALIAMPFGLDGMLWRLMGEGIDWMIAVALFVAGLPGAVGRMAAFGIGPLLLGTGGLVLLGLLKTPLRWSGGAVVVAASLWAIAAPQPDVLISSDGQAVAVRGADGRLSIHRGSRDAFAAREWLAADGDARLPDDATLGEGFRCDASGCIARLRRRQARLAGARRRRLRGGLPACRRRRDRPRSTTGLPGADRRPNHEPRPWRDYDQAERRGLGCDGGDAEGPGPAVGACRCRTCRDACTSPVAATAAGCNASNRGSGTGRVIRDAGRTSFVRLACAGTSGRLSPLRAGIADWSGACRRSGCARLAQVPH